MFLWKRSLVPTDFSRSCQTARDYACELAGQFSAELHVLHVLEEQIVTVQPSEFHLLTPMFDLNQLRASTELALNRIPGPARSGEIRVIRATRTGSPFVEIVRYARELDIELIVMGTHGRTGLRHMLLGSVAENVVRKAHCPVLTIRPPGHAFIPP